MEKKTVRLQLVMGESEVQALDDWRRRQRDVPNRSEAIRRLIMGAVDRLDDAPKKPDS
jgi:metal-responsive CopG/Arc/MetJ family transcriptional regulator